MPELRSKPPGHAAVHAIRVRLVRATAVGDRVCASFISNVDADHESPEHPSIQQRFPWIMWPLTRLDALLTPRRWSALFERAAGRITSALTTDTAPLARSLISAFGWLSAVHGRILAGRPVLMRIAWRVRQFIWSATWAFIVTMRLWPRRVGAGARYGQSSSSRRPRAVAIFKARD